MSRLDEFAVTRPLKDSEVISLALERGYVVSRPKQVEKTRRIQVPKGKTARVAVVSDTHLGSNYQQLTHLRTFYAYAEQKGVDFFLHCGDLTDGSPKMHRDAVFNMHRQGYQQQRDYVVEVYPKASVPTYIIAGNHDYSFVNGDGGRIVEDVCSRREDLNYLGEIGAYVQVGSVTIYAHHPFDGGAYALSYKLQKFIEQWEPRRKGHIVLKGNYHKAIHLPGYRNVEGFLVPSFQAQTPFMVGKSLASIIGGLILDIDYDQSGLVGLKTDWRLFHNPLPEDF